MSDIDSVYIVCRSICSLLSFKNGSDKVNYKGGYRDGVKRKGDKIGINYTHGAVGWVTEQHCEPNNR